MRISETQSNVLVLLLRFEARGDLGPVLGSLLLRMINGQRELIGKSKVAPQNFRVGCHTAVAHGLLEQYRDRTLRLAFRLTDLGRVHAELRMEQE